VSVILRDRPKASVRSRRLRLNRARPPPALAGSEAVAEIFEPATHVVLFIAGFLGRGFNSPRLHFRHGTSADVLTLRGCRSLIGVCPSAVIGRFHQFLEQRVFFEANFIASALAAFSSPAEELWISLSGLNPASHPNIHKDFPKFRVSPKRFSLAGVLRILADNFGYRDGLRTKCWHSE